MSTKFHSTKERILVILVFCVYMFLRIFSNSEYYFIQAGDAARYLTLAANFPYHGLDNNQLFLVHQPLYPYTIHFFSFLFEDHIAGIAVSLVSAAITFFIVYKLAKMLSNNSYITLNTLILFSLSEPYIRISTNVLRESFSVMLTLASLYYYIKFLKAGKVKNSLYSAFFGVLIGLTTDHALLLIPGLIISYFIFGGKSKKLYALLPLIFLILSYSSWLIVRIYTYSHNEYYPAGPDGTILKTSEWGIQQVLNPFYFKEMEAYIPFGVSFKLSHYTYPFLYMLNLFIAPWPTGTRLGNIIPLIFSKGIILKILIYLLLLIGVVYGLYTLTKSLFSHRFKRNGMLLSLFLFVIFASPMIQKMSYYRYTITAIIFLFLMISYGFFQLANKFKALHIYKIVISMLVLVLVLYLPFYYYSNSYFLLSKRKVIEAKNTAEFINSLPKDGVMAKIGYTQELNYLTNKRVMALPIDTKHIFLIKMYNISYLVYGGFYTRPFIDSDENQTIDYDAIKYIKENPKMFKLLKVIKEDYPIINKTDNIYVYEVI